MSNIADLVQARCPRCHTGPMFKYGPFNFIHFTAMYDRCPNCGLNYMQEPGFYTGAMYLSYAFSVGIFIACFIAVYFLAGNPDAWVYITTTISFTLLLAPLNFRYSRVMMLHWFGQGI
jgi:uncharacterized protein (DUF983 family)